ncbi:MAG: aminopeptidase P family protein, partial [Leptospiraceae bacterium]|nr:aminopeptidase P family protein [Leptospiraceae bacterium]
MSREIYNSEELAMFKKVQRIAYEAVCKVAERLEPGMTEKQAASMVAEELNKEGVRRYFHRPFAWFGDRTKFADFKKIGTLSFWKLFGLPHFGKQFQPSDRRLTEGMPVILDVAPTIDGYAADIGYATWCGTNVEVEQARMDLRKYRSLI